MAKFHDAIGFAEQQETAPDVWTDVITEHMYSGDVIRNSASWQPGETLNDNLVISNTISIVADTYANNNISAMRYVKWMGTAWEIKNIIVGRPRLILTIGGIYNGKQTGA